MLPEIVDDHVGQGQDDLGSLVRAEGRNLSSASVSTAVGSTVSMAVRIALVTHALSIAPLGGRRFVATSCDPTTAALARSLSRCPLEERLLPTRRLRPATVAFERRANDLAGALGACVVRGSSLYNQAGLDAPEPRVGGGGRAVIEQVNLYIPPEIQARIDTKELFRIGSVVRNVATGQVFKHLDEVTGPAKNQAERAVASLRGRLRNPWVIVGVTAAGVVVVGGAALIAARKRKRAILDCLKNFNASLRVYLETARQGQLDVGVVFQLISDLDAVQAISVDGVIAVDLSFEQWKTLISLVGDYTRKLAEANSIDLDNVLGDTADSENDSVVDLRRYLEAQRKIFARRAA